MPSTNEITGAEQKSKAYSAQGRINHDRIFAKKSAHKWAEESGVRILDDDGFRWNDGVDMDSLISYSEFQKRLPHCTIICDLFIQKADQFPHLFE